MHRLLLILCAAMLTLAASAIPARQTPFVATLADGSQVTLIQVGDEHFSYFICPDNGQRYLRQPGVGGAFYAVSDAELQNLEGHAQGERERLNRDRAARLEKLPSLVGNPMVNSVARQSRAPMTGVHRGLVLLVNYKDVKMAASHTQQAFNNMFNQVGYNSNYHIGSVHDYFYDQSYGQFDLEFDVVGPIELDYDRAYYGADHPTWGGDMSVYLMISEAVRKADDMGVDFSLYDWGGDGEVDQVYVIYAGYGQHNTQYTTGLTDNIWPHESKLEYYNATVSVDGVRVNTYACSCELSGYTGTTLDGIGTACHEFSHCLGYPDFYDTSYSGGFGMNHWDILDSGSYNGPTGNGEQPCGYSAYERWVAGWLEPTVLDEGCDITDMPDIYNSPTAYIVYNQRYKNEYFMIENRQNTRWFTYFNTFTAGHGLLISHVDYSASAWTNNTPNALANHQRMSLVPADGDYGTLITSGTQKSYRLSSSEAAGDPFPGSRRVTEFINGSHDAVGGKLFNRNVDGTYNLNRPITNITENNTTHTVSFYFNGGADDGTRYTATFDAGTGTCSTSSYTQRSRNEYITMPTAVAPEGWTFIGWTTTPVGYSDTRPSELCSPEVEVAITDNTTFYAVYTNAEEAYIYDDACYNLQDDAHYIFCSSTTEGAAYCLTAADLSESPSRSFPITPVNVVLDAFGNPVIDAPKHAYTWYSEAGPSTSHYLSNGSVFLGIGGTGAYVTDTPQPIYNSIDYGLLGLNTSGTSSYRIRFVNGTAIVSTTGSTTARLFPYVLTTFAPEGTAVVYASSPQPVDGISTVTLDRSTGMQPLYNIAGQRVRSGATGITISADGRKVIK